MEMQVPKLSFRASSYCALPFSNSFFHCASAQFLDQEFRGFHAPGYPAAFLRKLCCDMTSCPCVTRSTAETAQYCKEEKGSPLSTDALKEN